MVGLTDGVAEGAGDVRGGDELQPAINKREPIISNRHLFVTSSSLESHDDFMKIRGPLPHPPSILELGAIFRERPRSQKRASERAFKGAQGESSRLFLSIDGFGYAGRSSSPTEEATILLRNVPPY